MTPEVPKRGERPRSPEVKRPYPYLGIMGATGVGKTTLAENVLGKYWGVKVFAEQYPDNPWLVPFYHDPPRYSFVSEMFFLEAKINQMSSLNDSLLKEMQVHDPARELDGDVYAYVHHLMGWMSDDEYSTYRRANDTLGRISHLPEPDVFIAVLASPQVVVERIKKRGRPYELHMLKNHPEYFPRLAERVFEWVEENSSRVPIISVNAEEHDFATNPNHQQEVLNVIGNEIRYRLFSSQEGKAADGTELIMPKVLVPSGNFSAAEGDNSSKTLRGG